MKQIVQLKDDGSFALDLRYFRHASGEGANYQVKDGIPSGGGCGATSSRAARAAARPGGAARGSPSRHRALGAGDLRERLLQPARRAAQRYGSRRVVLAGGCAYNSVANGKISSARRSRSSTSSRPAATPAAAIGAAFATWHKVEGARPAPLRDGPRLLGAVGDAREIAVAIAARRDDFEAAGCKIMRIADEATLCKRTAAAIAEGKVIGWFQGRLNGARARSATARSWAIRGAPT
jgi:carbamoyltransferase